MNAKKSDNKFMAGAHGAHSHHETRKENTTMKKPTTMTDSNGNAIPIKYVSSYDRHRDAVARRIHARFVKGRKFLEQLVSDSIVELDKLSQLKETLGDKGNFSAQSFDGLIRVNIRQRYNIFLDERVAKARELMLGYIDRILSKVSESEAKPLRLIINEAFRANSQGFLSTSKIFSLLRMEINDPSWHEAKEILQDSIKPQKGKRYLSCDIRKRVEDDFTTIRLDIADCWPDSAPAAVTTEA